MKPVEAVRVVSRELEEAGVSSPRVDAEHLVAHVLGVGRTEVYSHDGELCDEQSLRLRSLADRRRVREPLAYILGEWGFRRLVLAVDRRVLIPRPETEVVVERCLVLLSEVAEPRVLDVGTGSGAIALAIAEEHPAARVTAVDRSPDALAVARSNLERASVNGRVRLLQSELFAAVDGPFDLVVSNPPYVEPEEFETLEPEVRLWEPMEALVGPGTTEAIVRGAADVLVPGGRLVLECADGRSEHVAGLLGDLGYADVAITSDLAGRPRIVDARRP